MYYKPDWNQAQSRLLSFWENAGTSRLCMGALAELVPVWQAVRTQIIAALFYG